MTAGLKIALSKDLNDTYTLNEIYICIYEKDRCGAYENCSAALQRLVLIPMNAISALVYYINFFSYVCVQFLAFVMKMKGFCCALTTDPVHRKTSRVNSSVIDRCQFSYWQMLVIL